MTWPVAGHWLDEESGNVGIYCCLNKEEKEEEEEEEEEEAEEHSGRKV